MVNIFKVVAETYRRVLALSSVDSYSGSGGWFGIIREAWGGAWQANVALDSPKNILAFSAVYACVTLIASDIAKCCIDLCQEGEDGVETEVLQSPFLAVLAKPNAYQTRLQFIEQWMTQKLLHGNTYVLKVREKSRGIVKELHVLDSQRVQTMVADSGDVFYQVSRDNLSGVEEQSLYPASEIIHDRMVCLFHPLVGVSPIFACATSATMGNKIQSNSLRFFKNMSRPSGHLTAPGKIDTDTANRMKEEMEKNYSGDNIGRIMVTGAGLEYKPMNGMSAVDAQLIDQLKFSVEDVGRSFRMPLFKIGGEVPRGSTVEMLNLVYYTDCLQTNIESLELCLDEGLELPVGYYTKVDLDGLLRMDQSALIKAEGEAVKACIKAPNEARKKLGLKAVEGGDSPMIQQQWFSLAALAKRDARPDPFATTSSAPSGDQGQRDQTQQDVQAFVRDFSMAVLDRLRAAPQALPAPSPEVDEKDIAFFVAAISEELRAVA